jgi:hypothetical protein
VVLDRYGHLFPDGAVAVMDRLHTTATKARETAHRAPAVPLARDGRAMER